MNSILNYIIEANIGLLMLLVVYKLLLSKETQFGAVRFMLLSGIAAAVIFPLFTFDQATIAPGLSIGKVLPHHLLPQVVLGEEATSPAASWRVSFWIYLSGVYMAGVMISLMLVMTQLTRLLRMIKRSSFYRVDRLHVIESVEHKPAFSFFRFIFIGNAHQLSPEDKHQIILHERVHASKWHSIDILLIHTLKVVFWFNPFMNTYLRIFIQLHEFEADARAVEKSDVNKYCTLLARVALQSANIHLANHFSNSLTIKRIEMMRTLKNKINPWRIAAMGLGIVLLFCLLACQDLIGTTDAGRKKMVPTVDQHAYPEGGLENFYNDVKMNLRYPASARRDHKDGMVRVQFVVNEDGTLSNLRLIDTPHPALGEEVVRVLSLSNKWVPANRNGIDVKEEMVFPVIFNLDFPGKGTEGQQNAAEIIPDLLSLDKIVVVGYTN